VPPESALPPPDADASAHSARVVARIRAEIADADGWIPFSRYMELALYAPGLGYYAAGAAKLGAAGDFVTAPEMTPLFASALSNQVAAILDATKARDLFELGAGTGRLAADLLNALAVRNALPSTYTILEPSPDLRQRQRVMIASIAAHHLASVRWLDRLPDTIDGAVIANEVLDSIPVHLVARRGDAWRERGVVALGRARVGADRSDSAFAWDERPADPWLSKLARARYPSQGEYLSEINPVAEALIETIGKKLIGGAAIFLDYGFPAAEYYHPQRSTGTLMCHYRHRSHDDPFMLPGLTDITAHVDFSAIAAAGMRAGLAVAGFTAHAPFLLGCGILDALAATGEPESLVYIKSAAPVQKLLSPAEMGELVKVLALQRSAGIAWPGFTLADRSHRL
jgi:SAM-dependent MidA family methyltransferase